MSTDKLAGYEPDENEPTTKKGRYTEFDCPSCNAHNPWGDGFKDNDEVNCHYCGTTFVARVNDDGNLKLKEA